MINAIIFDLDGTLIDSMHVWDYVDDMFLSEIGHERTPTFYDDMAVLHFEETADYFINTYSLTMTREEVLCRLTELADEQYRYHIPAKPFVKEFLAEQKKKGLRLCVATANQRSLTETALKRLGLYDYFDFILTCADIGVGKNSPEIYLEAARRMGFPPEETAVVEDALHGVETAAAAGFYVIAISDPSAEEDRGKITLTANMYIDSFSELLSDKTEENK